MGNFKGVLTQSTQVGIVLSLLACYGASGAVDCKGLSDFASKNGVFIPGDDAGRIVAGSGRLQFYSAPSYFCKKGGVFVVENQTVSAYVEYNGFASIVYLGDKQEKPVIGWVRSDRLRPNDLGIAPSQK